ALIVLVLLRFTGAERNLNSVAEIASNPLMMYRAAEQLIALGGISERCGNHIKGMFDSGQVPMLSKEGSGVVSTLARFLSFLDSDVVAKSLAVSTFDPAELRAGAVLFLQIMPQFLESHKGLLRVWISTLIRVLGAEGSEDSEVLILLDEASALSGLASI